MPMTVWRRVASLSMFSLLAALGGCAPPGVVQAVKPVLSEPPRAAPYPHELLSVESGSAACPQPGDEAAGTVFPGDGSLRGEPDFDPAGLPATLRCWYEALWTVLQDPARSAEYTGRAASDDLYTYARALNTHVSTLLTALRVTGDLALLDEVDRLAQHMRSALEDGWRGPAAFDNDGVDGFLNWVWRQSSSQLHRGRDVHEIDEMRTHAMVAQMAWAFALNGDAPSPNGVDYAERAEFWTGYLVDDFEAKWRQRNDVPWPKFPFLTRPHLHETMDFIRYHEYLYRLTGEQPYADEARRLSRLVYDNFVEVEAESGPALVTPRSLIALGGQQEYLIPSTYVRYVYATAVDLHFEGLEPWADDDVMTKLARSLADFIIDDDADDFARDVGGGVERGGVPPSDPDDWGRFTAARYNISPYALLSPWDRSGRISEVSQRVYSGVGRGQRDVFIPVAMMLDAALN